MENKIIPKIIHYCWFGDQPKSKIFEDCFKSWQLYLPDYEIIEWNEHNILLDCKFAQQAYANKKWAFVADYVRLKVLYEYGGIYLDTDMLFLKSLNGLLNNDFFVGVENSKTASTGILGSVKSHIFIELCLTHYQNINFDINNLKPIPLVVTNILKEHYGFSVCEKILGLDDGITIYPTSYFYPLPLSKAEQHYQSYVKPETIAVHLWEGSWLNEWNHFRMGHLWKAFQKVKERLKNEPLDIRYLLKLKIYLLLLPIWIIKAILPKMI